MFSFIGMFCLISPSKADTLRLPGWHPILENRTTAWDGMEYKAYPPGPPELSAYYITLPAKTVLPWHKHTAPCVAYILSGAFQIEKVTTDGKVKKSKLYVGDSKHPEKGGIPQTVGEWHRGVVIGDKKVECVMFFAGAPGHPPVIEATAEEKKLLPP